MEQFAKESITIAKYFGWQTIGLISSDHYGCDSYFEIIPQMAKSAGIKVRKHQMSISIDSGQDRKAIRNALHSMKDISRGKLFFYVLLGRGAKPLWDRGWFLKDRDKTIETPTIKSTFFGEKKPIFMAITGID